MCGCMHTYHSAHIEAGGPLAGRSWFPPSTLWVLGIALPPQPPVPFDSLVHTASSL